MSSFSEIRSLLQRAPHRGLWGALCERLDELPEHERDELALPYIEGHTRRWPAAWCEAPQRWIEDALTGTMPPFWGLVRHLNLNCHYLNDAQIEALLGSELLARVELLNLDSNRAGARIGQILAHAPALGSVTHVWLGYNYLQRADMDALAGAHMPALTTLSLDGNKLDAKEMEALLEAPWFGQLTSLDVRECKLSAPSLTKILEAAPRLTALRLDHNALGGALHRLNALPPGQLTSLELDSCAGDRAKEIELFMSALAALAASGHLDALHMLDLGGNALSDEALAALCAAPRMDRLERLLARRSALSMSGVSKLRDAAFARALKRLEIAHLTTAYDALRAAGADVNAVVITSG